MSKNKLSFLLSIGIGICQLSIPVKAQTLLPYTPGLNMSNLEQQGLQMAETASQLIQFPQHHDHALARAKIAVQLAPQEYQTWFVLGTLHIVKHNFLLGIDALQKSLDLEPQKTVIKFALGNAYFKQGNYQLAVFHLKEGLKSDPSVSYAQFDLGNVYLKLGKIQESMIAYQKAIDIQKDYWPAINNIALIKYEQEDSKEAIEQWRKALKINSEHAEPRMALGVALYIQGKKQEGIQLTRSAFLIDDNYSNLEYLKDNLWGEKLLRDTQTLLSDSTIRFFLNELHKGPRSTDLLREVR